MTVRTAAFALCATLAMAATTGYAADPTIAVTVSIDGKQQTSQLTEQQLRQMLAETGFDKRTIDTAVASGMRDGALVLEGTSQQAQKKAR